MDLLLFMMIGLVRPCVSFVVLFVSCKYNIALRIEYLYQQQM